jgi:putative salt-induced outer membrane protein YdiY
MPTIAAEAAGELPFAEADALLDDESVSEVEPAWYRATYWFGPSPWDSGIELGLNGSTGTNESFSLRTGGYVKRKSKYSKLDFSLYHNRTASAGLITQNNAKMDFRNDWMLGDGSPWTLFAKGTLFYDGFQAYDLQTNANTGIGYQFFNLAELELTGRVGGGASREFGGPDNEWLPEGLFGFEYEQRLTATQKLACKLDYHPEIEQFSHYRLVTEASWEISLDKPSNISLKLSATDRYDTTPNGTDPHLVNYSVLLLLKL